MIVLDTGIVLEPMRAEPHPAVLRWFGDQNAADLYLTAIAEAELRLAAALEPAGDRRRRLSAAIRSMLEQDFAGRILPFDRPAARACAAIAADRLAAGEPIPTAACQVAAIVRVHAAALATADPEAFAGCGIPLIDPRQEP